jgi:ApaG protein
VPRHHDRKGKYQINERQRRNHDHEQSRASGAVTAATAGAAAGAISSGVVRSTAIQSPETFRPLRRAQAQSNIRHMAGSTEALYRATTRDIEVRVTPRFLEERSSPDKGQYFWAYTIEIVNRGEDTVQLQSRHWRITDALGRTQEVRGAGVVGEQPVLKPGQSFEYTSGVPLTTASGFMTGTYGMMSAKGERFDIEIPAFSLDSPGMRRTVN